MHNTIDCDFTNRTLATHVRYLALYYSYDMTLSQYFKQWERNFLLQAVLPLVERIASDPVPT